MWAYVMLQVETRSKKEMLESNCGAICVFIFIMEVVLDL